MNREIRQLIKEARERTAMLPKRKVAEPLSQERKNRMKLKMKEFRVKVAAEEAQFDARARQSVSKGPNSLVRRMISG